MTERPAKAFAHYAYRRSADQDRLRPAHHKVIVVGAGPVGLTLAAQLGQRGIPVVLIDDSDRIGDGSRAICFSKRSLEILDRVGVGERAVAKGVQWSVGKVFHRDALLYRFDLLSEPGHKMPAFINLQQYYLEKYLIDRIEALPAIDLRWRNRVSAVANRGGAAEIGIETPDGPYRLTADWVIACDGSRSAVRDLLGIPFTGEAFEDQFLIADVKMTAAFPTERWFWFEPPFHSGQSALLHKQPDDVWRIDLQLSPTADAEQERRPEVVRPRLERMLGHADFDLEWVSIYRFQCCRIASFVHDRVVFAGDSAHQVSPFGARGANSGIQDADNLSWKLAAILRGTAPASLMATYDSERSQAADENILHSTRSTDFIAPHTAAEKALRDAVLGLAGGLGFAKRMVNSGRLSLPTAYRASPLSTPDTATDAWAGGPAAGASIPDAPLAGVAGKSFLSETLGDDFTLLLAGIDAPDCPPGVSAVRIGIDGNREFAGRFDARPGTAYLVRPDGHVAARWRTPNRRTIEDALHRALGR